MSCPPGKQPNETAVAAGGSFSHLCRLCLRGILPPPQKPPKPGSGGGGNRTFDCSGGASDIEVPRGVSTLERGGIRKALSQLTDQIPGAEAAKPGYQFSPA